ncbi:putative non-specific protein-tyrosine kinase [Helianthus annuus]|nr:putative non-specific protein-tyrosine kinase [Helianthus annuus]
MLTMANICTHDSGYVSAEYHMTLCLSPKEDVFNFGVLVLETVTGQSNNRFIRVANNEEFMLINLVRTEWLEGTLTNVIDPRIDADPILMTKFIEIGLLCVQERAAIRPTMKEVIGMLLGTLSLTLPVSEMRTRIINGVQPSDES